MFLSARTEPHQTFDQLEVNLINARSQFAKFLTVGAQQSPEVLTKISAQQERTNPSFPATVFERLVPNAVFRDLSAGTFSAAGALIDPTPTGREWIRELLPYSAGVAAGVNVLELPKALPFKLPRIQQSAAITWATAENSATTAQTGTPSFDQVDASWFQAQSVLQFSKQLVDLAPVDHGVEAELISHFNRAKAAAIDNALFAGNGSTQPLGLANVPTGSGLANATTISATPTWTQVTGVIETVESLNAFSNDGTSCWVLPPSVKQTWSTTPKFATTNTGGLIYCPDTKTVAGERALATTDAGSNVYYSSRWSNVAILLSNTTAFTIDPFTLAHENLVKITLRFLISIVCRRPESIVIATIG
jgi:HK97 family phage major capsid protein